MVVLYVWQQHGLQTTARFCCLAAVFCALAILLVAALKGGVSGGFALYNAYSHTAATNADFNLSLLERVERAIGQGKRILALLPFYMPLLLLGLCAPWFEAALRTKKALALYILGIGMTFAPLVEVLVKRPYSYHLGQMFIGTGIFVSYGFYALFQLIRNLRRPRPIISWLVAGFVALGQVFLAQDYIRTMRYAAGWSLHFAPVTVLGDWSSPAVNDSYYLRMASFVRQYSKPGDTILSTSGNVFPLTGRVPPGRDSAALSDYLLTGRGVSQSDAEIANLIRAWKPAIFVQEHNGLLPIRKRIDAIESQVADLYGMSIDVGPGLSPYRQFFATVHVARSPAW